MSVNLKPKKPVIGILGSIMETKNALSGEMVKRNFTNDTCVRSIAENGGIPLIIPFVKEREDEPELMERIFAMCDGMLFPGGCDVDPCFYGEEPHEKLGKTHHDLDVFWFGAARYAKEHGLAIMGICRGMQLLNVAWGGSLYQDMSEQDTKVEIEHVQHTFRHALTHAVRAEPGTRLANILGTEPIMTNSMHHQAVKKTGAGLVVSAHAEDGTTEAIESADGQLLAVQWHPEDLLESAPVMNKLFQDFVSRAGASIKG